MSDENCWAKDWTVLRGRKKNGPVSPIRLSWEKAMHGSRVREYARANFRPFKYFDIYPTGEFSKTNPSGLISSEISMPREDAAALLRQLASFGDKCSDGCKSIRDNLRLALGTKGNGNIILKADGPEAAALAGLGISYVLGG